MGKLCGKILVGDRMAISKDDKEFLMSYLPAPSMYDSPSDSLRMVEILTRIPTTEDMARWKREDESMKTPEGLYGLCRAGIISDDEYWYELSKLMQAKEIE